MRQPDRESKLGWQDAVLILIIVVVLAVVLLFQVAQRTDALPLAKAADGSHRERVTVVPDMQP